MVIVAFPPGEKYAVNYTTLDQYDYGQILRIQGLKLPKTVEVHFSTQETGGTSITRVGVTKDGVTDVLIPDSVLENGDTTQNYSIFAFVYITDATSGKTEYRARLEVKARPKPEVPGGGDSPDVFHEAVLEVRKSAEKAEEAQKQAEGYAHGREDIPERAEDNAMYYAGKASEDAKKTAQDRAEVERLVESVSGIDEQVTKVEELSKNAQEAATQAGTSAEQADLHKQAAETASSVAQAAAQETEADRTSVEKTKETVENLSTQVQKNKESVDKTAQDFELTAQQAFADVNNAGQTQAERVQTAGTTAVENIENAQNTATQAVETAKAEAIKTVADKGKEVLEAIPNFDAKLDTKLDKNQGAEHAGKALVIGEDGNVVPGKPQTEGVGDAADAIVNTVSGMLLNIEDSAERKNKGFGMSGKSEQVQTTGAQLLNYYKLAELSPQYYAIEQGELKAKGSNNAAWTSVPEYGTLAAGTYTISGNNVEIRDASKNTVIATCTGDTFSKFTLNEDTAIKMKVGYGLDKYPTIVKAMLNKGDSKKPYEPYTGGKPSPSPEYPQEIVNAGRLNSDTGKYEIDVKVTGKNIVNIPDFGADTPDTIKECYISKNICISAQEKADVSKSVWRFKALHKDGSLEYITDAVLPGCFYATEENPIVSITYRGIYMTREYKGIMVEYGTVATPYEPYKEQTLTLTSDRPLTKWDRLVEQNGQIGWLYATKYIEDLAEIIRDNTPIYGTEQKYFNVLFENEKFNYSMEKVVSETGHYKVNKGLYTIDVKKNTFLIKINADDTIQTAKEHLHYSVMYNTTQTEFVPLPQEQQNAIRALITYYPTTVVSNSEDTEMKLSYVADTKNYTDRKIEEAASAQVQNLANLLSLMPLSTQAAMIENDTNNILDMEVQK